MHIIKNITDRRLLEVHTVEHTTGRRLRTFTGRRVLTANGPRRTQSTSCTPSSCNYLLQIENYLGTGTVALELVRSRSAGRICSQSAMSLQWAYERPVPGHVNGRTEPAGPAGRRTLSHQNRYLVSWYLVCLVGSDTKPFWYLVYLPNTS